VRAPFPWFGGKSLAAPEVWAALGDVANYVEPFAGSLAVLLARPHAPRTETVNDLDGFVVNFWRAVAADPEAVRAACDWPVTELDLTARHLWLVANKARLRARLEADPEHYDPRVAGWWVWGLCAWIGRGWCSGTGPWAEGPDGALARDAGRGVHRQLPHLGDAGRGVHSASAVDFVELSARLRRVRVTCGSWERVTTPSVCEKGPGGSAGVLLDPPYPEGLADGAYAASEAPAAELWRAVQARAVELSDRGCRVVVAGHSGTWAPPAGWTERPWRARKGYAQGRADALRHREVLWCSPGCLP